MNPPPPVTTTRSSLSISVSRSFGIFELFSRRSHSAGVRAAARSFDRGRFARSDLNENDYLRKRLAGQHPPAVDHHSWTSLPGEKPRRQLGELGPGGGDDNDVRSSHALLGRG